MADESRSTPPIEKTEVAKIWLLAGGDQPHPVARAQRLHGVSGRHCPVLVLGDREFHSPKLAEWLDSKGLAFILRQKKDLHFQTAGQREYQVVKDLDIRPGMAQFYPAVAGNKGDGLGPFNLAIYWQRQYRGKGPKAPWYILTNLSAVKPVMAIYRCRWGIEQLFKDCKTGGYNLEATPG
jgi:hypothetical protein